MNQVLTSNDCFRPLGASIGNDLAGGRLDDTLAQRYPFLSRNQWQKRIKNRELLVNHQPAKASYRLQLEDQLSFYQPHDAEPEVNRDIRILWERGDLMAVYKPADLPMHENGKYRQNTFAQILNEEYGEGWAAVHRLDKETSGIVICSKNPTQRAHISKALQQRNVYKRYIAISKGVPEQSEWVETGSIGDLHDSQIRIKKWVVDGGQSAETRFRLIAATSTHSLIEAFPKTGRTNQIRIHLAFNNLPIAGEKLYHDNEELFLKYWKDGNSSEVKRLAGFDRLCLHASEIGFIDPTTGDEIFIQAPLAKDVQKFWNDLTVGNFI
jgi:RluA family pseudouridine synthase